MPKPSPLDLMREGIETYEQRNAVYRGSHEIHGQLLRLLFPDGVDLSDAASAVRFGIFNSILMKVVRYAVAFPQGGHRDSAHDIGVTGFILESETAETEGQEYRMFGNLKFSIPDNLDKEEGP